MASSPVLLAIYVSNLRHISWSATGTVLELTMPKNKKEFPRVLLSRLSSLSSSTISTLFSFFLKYTISRLLSVLSLLFSSNLILLRSYVIYHTKHSSNSAILKGQEGYVQLEDHARWYRHLTIANFVDRCRLRAKIIERSAAAMLASSG